MNILQFERLLRGFWSDEDGVTAIEYALLAALIFGVIVVSVGLLGDNVKALYDDIAKQVSDAIS